MAQQQDKTFFEKLQEGYCTLTHQLIKSSKLNQITFSLLKLIQTLQIIHFVFRDQFEKNWSSPIFNYIKLAINYISFDYLISSSPGIYTVMLIIILSFLFLIVTSMVFIGYKFSGKSKRSTILKSVLPPISFCLYLFKTVLQIPTLILILSTFIPTFQQNMNVSDTSPGISVMFGIFIMLLFSFVQTYLITSFKDNNPFSQLIHSGETTMKCILSLFLKIILCLELAVDFKANFAVGFSVVFVFINVFWTFYLHSQIGYYKVKVRATCIRLNYTILVFSFLTALKHIRPNDEMSFMLYLVLNYIMCFLISQFIQNKLALNSIQKKMMFIKDQSDLELHVLYLIRYIDTFQKRQSRIMLQGYLAYHSRQCKLSESQCSCRVLKQIKDRSQEQKSQFFHFVIDILKQNLHRFPDSKRIHLLLSFIYQYRLKNRFQSIYSITRTLKQDFFLNRLYFYHQTHLIEAQMIQDDSKQSSGKTIDVNKFFQYNNLVVKFQEKMEICTRNHIEFWKELLQVNTDIKKLQKAGTFVTNSKDTMRDQFQNLLGMNPNNIHILFLYGKFLIDVANQQATNIKYIQKAETILKNLKQSSKIEDNSSKYTDNAQTTIVVINGNQGKLGEIIHTNNYVHTIVGYKRSECIGLNVNVIMPKIFGEYHNEVLGKYLSSSAQRFNGKERVVPALAKDGYMIPVVALTKPLPNLLQGITIVGFLSKLEERPEQQQVVRKYSYLLYRADNQQVVGVSKSCYSDFHIPCCLIYGNPFNSNNELKIKNLFGFSFQKQKEGQVSAALQTSEVVLTMNTKRLSQEFIITGNNSSHQINDNLLQIQTQDFGVQVKIVAKCILSLVYNKTPLKLLSIYKYGEDYFQQKNSELSNKKQDLTDRYNLKTGEEDFKDLKDFKNFISIKSEPSAISFINNICCLLIFIIASSIITFIVFWIFLQQYNMIILDCTRIGLNNEIILPDLLFELQKLYINRDPNLMVTQFNQTQIANNFTQMLNFVKLNQREYLPLKYMLLPQYDNSITEFTTTATGQILQVDKLIDEVITLSISSTQTLLNSYLSVLYNDPVDYTSNPYLLYLYTKYNELFSIREGSSKVLNDLLIAYNETVSSYIVYFWILSGLMGLVTIAWLFLSIPYVLSVTKINNRVLSLFSLIPHKDVLKLIGRCIKYLKDNLTEAVVSEDQMDQILQEDAIIINGNQSNLSSSASPTSFLVSKDFSNSNANKKFKSTSSNFQLNSPQAIQQKFIKMVNSQNHQKKVTIIQFLLVAIFLIGFVLFNHFYAINTMSSIGIQVQSLKDLGTRVSIFCNIKLLLTEYLMNSKLQITNTTQSIKQLNIDLIDNSYALQTSLLTVSINSEIGKLENYNSGNLCNYINQYSSYSIFPQSLTRAQCLSLNGGILTKGIKTTLVTLLQEVRSIVSMSTVSNLPQVLNQKMILYEKIQKYIRIPMLQVISGTQKQLNSMNSSYQIILIVSSSIFLVIVIGFWRIIWMIYIEQLNNKIWRTKGMLNIIPMRIITANQLLKNEFTSGQLQNAVR